MERIKATDYCDLVDVSEPRISPDEEHIAYIDSTPKDDREYAATIHVVPATGGENRQFTLDNGRDAEPRWSPDGEQLAFVSTRGERGNGTELWSIPIDGGEAVQLTTTVGSVSQIAWSPDGTHIAFTQRVTAKDRETGRDLSCEGLDNKNDQPDPRVIDRLVYRSNARYFDGHRTHVYLLNVESGQVTRITSGDYDFSGPEWGDEETLYYHVKQTDDPDDSLLNDIVRYDLATGETETITQVTGVLTSIAATSDGQVAYQYMPAPKDNEGVQQTEIEVVDLESGEINCPTSLLDRTLGSSFQWGPDEESLYVVTPDEGRFSLWRVFADMDAEPERLISSGTIEDFDVGDNIVAYSMSEWNHPGDIFVATTQGDDSRQLTKANNEYLEERAVSEPEELWFEAEDGTDIQGWVLTPPDFDPDETYPLVVEIHGGPTAMWSQSGTMWHEFQTLAARGYVVFWCNPRGSTGYGEEFMVSASENRADCTLQDVLAGADLVCARDYIDEDSQFVTGGSFGGFMTVWAISHTDRFRAATPQRGSYNPLITWAASSAFKYLEHLDGGPPWDNPDSQRTPIDYGMNISTPTLVIHSDRDFKAHVINGDLLFRFLKKRGVETRYIRYPREGHELSRSGEPRHVVDRMERIIRWFDGYSDHHDVPKAIERGDDGLSTTDTE